MTKGTSNQWFKHEHGKGDAYKPEPVKSRTGPIPHAGDNKHKQQPDGAPDWYQHKGAAPAAAKSKASAEVVNGADGKQSRTHTADAQENLERNRGSASDWYQHGNKSGAKNSTPSANARPRKTTTDSENWFSHDDNKGYVQPKPAGKAPSPAAKQMVENSRGKGMENTLVGKSEPAEVKPARVKQEASDIAQKNVQGMMSKYLSQDANKGYQSNRPGGRVVKQEASANADRNRGVLGDELGGGYANAAPRKREGARVKPEAAAYADRNKGSMGSVISGSNAADARPASRTKPEAEANRTRNAGHSFSQLMGGSGTHGPVDQPKQRIVSASARACADRNQGSIGNLLGMG